MALSPGALGKTSVAHEHRMTSDHDVFSSCLLGRPLTSELTLTDSFLLSLMEKNENQPLMENVRLVVIQSLVYPN